LDDGETARIKAELKWLTNELGPARDLDVYITGSVKPLDRALPATRGIETLQNDLEKRRSDAFARARKAVASARYRALVLETVGWIESGEWTTTGDELIRARRERRADDFAREEIARRGRKVSRRAGKLGKLDARRRHKLRVAIKKLRYAIGFFESLFAGRKAKKRLRRFVRQLKELQDCLGALNDIAVQRRLSGDVVDRGGRRRNRIFAVGVVSGREQTRVDPLRDAAVAAADRFVELHPF
jgi:CHAD domain-containing protein